MWDEWVNIFFKGVFHCDTMAAWFISRERWVVLAPRSRGEARKNDRKKCFFLNPCCASGDHA